MILGIESSCDETAAAVVRAGRETLSNIVASQIATHARFGGVVPELASREHLRNIVPVVRAALEQAGVGLRDLDAIAVTSGPGLAGALLVGITYAKSLAYALAKPLIAVNHLEGHIHAVLLEAAAKEGAPIETPETPILALVVSGGHTHLYLADYIHEDNTDSSWHYENVGRTVDDAAGEAFDKVAKLLGYGYPGGPLIDRLAPYGDPRAVRFTFAKMKGNALDFSFSGLKTAVLRWVEARAMDAEIDARRALVRENPSPSVDEWLAVTPQATRDLLASFQHAVIHELLTRAQAAAESMGARALIISGGVACNSGLRAAAGNARLPYPVYFPSPGLSTDNAAMIAAAAFPKLARGEFAGLDVKAQANLTLA